MYAQTVGDLAHGQAVGSGLGEHVHARVDDPFASELHNTTVAPFQTPFESVPRSGYSHIQTPFKREIA
jgi:hypothetical protein